MEESIIRPDLHVNVTRQSPLRPNGSSTRSTGSSGRTTPRNSPTYRRLNSSRTPRRDGRNSGGRLQWFRSSRIVYWLLLITLWTYLGFYVQSRWAHDNNKEEFLGFGGRNGIVHSEITARRDLLGNETSIAVNNKIEVEDGKGIEVSLAKKETESSSNQTVVPRKKDKRPVRRLRRRARGRKKAKIEDESNEPEVQELDIPKRNTSYGLLVGPFGTTEDQILGWSREKRTGTCDRKGAFARLVWSRKFVLIFHELSMTGAPLSMLELATELLSCGATVSVVVLSRKGGLMPELAKRRIKVLDDRADMSFKAAMKADLVIAGSAVCTSWIDQYITRFPAGGSQIVWWIMENRREYFDRSKIVLDRVKMVVFLSESQSRQWLTWCEGEGIKLRSPPAVVELSVNDELAFVAGIPCSLNSPSSTPEMMLEKKQLLRSSVRREMGLNDNDMLVMSLSSINPGKGQLLLLESAKLLAEHDTVQRDPSNLADKHHLRSLLQDPHRLGEPSEDHSLRLRRVLSDDGVAQEPVLKVLVGSVGSKSNKIPYVKEILGFVSQHSNLSKSVLWTPSTTRVASLYSAADVYVINSQGIGETFGRVTIEAMAFGLPVLGTDAGGTKEIVEHNVTGLLHPVGRQGSRVLAENLRYMVENGEARKEMGKKGREKVERKYLKKHMYRKFGELLYKCMRIK
ncbi:N-acetyl-alpha-D-glucosaminyl L-malate synthase [Linum perenne]